MKRFIDGPPRIPSTLPPLSEGRAVDDEAEMERRYCADLSRRMLEFELDPINFFKMPRGSFR